MNSAGQKNGGGNRHGDEQFDLMMQPAAIVQKADGCDQRCAEHDPGTLRTRRAIQREEDRQHDRAEHSQSTQ